MSAILGITGLIGFFITLIVLIIKTVNHKAKKTQLVLLAVFIAFFIIGLLLPTPISPTENTVSESEITPTDTTSADESSQTISDTNNIETNTVPSEPHEDESLRGRGLSDTGRNEPNYTNIIGYVVVSIDEEHQLSQTDKFQDNNLWQIPTYEADKQFWNQTETLLPHKAKVVVKEQQLKHEGYGRYSGYLLVETLDNHETYYINVSNFVTKPYWTYTEDLIAAAQTGTFIAEYHQSSDFYPVNSVGEKVELQDGTIVLVTGTNSAPKNAAPNESAIVGIVWREWKNGYGGVDINFNSKDLSILY